MNAVRRLVPRPIRRAASGYLARRTSGRLQRDLAAMAARSAPIIAGPWLGEVGFELLYWVPFLRWCAAHLDVDPDRFVAMSRGGTASWYRPFAARYADAFSHVDPATFRDRHDARVRDLGEQKQTRVTEFDRQLIDSAMRAARAADWSLLHPSRMYELLNPYWWDHQSRDWVLNHTRYDKLTLPADPGLADLPSTYVAVKFYFNDCFPPTPQNRAFVRDALGALAARGPVIALSTGLNIDDHGGVSVDELQGTPLRRSGDGVRHLPEGIDPARNLGVQSAIVARARAFVGTYGGFSYMAPFYGVRSVAFYSDPNGFSRKHLDMAHAAFEAIGTGGFLDVRDAAGGAEAAEQAWTATA